MKCIACGVPGAAPRHCCDDAPPFCNKCFDEHQKIAHDYKDTCPDCGVKPGEPHRGGCDVERCTVCKGQRLQCVYMDDDGKHVDEHPEHDPQEAAWTGLWPGEAECREHGFWCVERRNERHPIGGCFWPCTADYPGAREDLNRWAVFSQTGKDPYPPDMKLLGQ